MAAPRFALNHPSTLRILATGGAMSWGWAAISDDDDEIRNSNSIHNNNANRHPFSLSTPLFSKNSLLFARSTLEPNRTSMEAAPVQVSKEGEETTPSKLKATIPKTKKTLVYDFVVIGNGNAGQSALRVLQERCPSAKIAMIDPLRPSSAAATNKSKSKLLSVGNSNKMDYYPETATGFHPHDRTVQLLADPTLQLEYKYGILLATGARGAPPPLELFEESALSRVLELRTTELVGNHNYPRKQKRPVLPPERVRRAVIETASQGARIGILGSGWEALDLACAAAEVAHPSSQKRRRNAMPTIVFGSPGPVWHILPQYLSLELRKKIRKQGIDIQDRSIVRYIANVNVNSNRDGNVNGGTTQELELHTAKTYDLLETQRTKMDLLIVAPDSLNAKGSAALPTTETPERMKESSDGRPWYKTWSQLTKTSAIDPSVVVCYEDDGRVAVNTELCAASRIYAAGSVAKYPNSSTGHASVAGEGTLDGAVAGRIAALNMSRSYVERSGFLRQSDDDTIHSFATHGIPVWRSDVTSYLSRKGEAVPSSLANLGVQALCVGNCDSERLSTRAFWWTNSSAQRRVITRLMEDSNDEVVEYDEDDAKRHLRRRNTRRRRKLGLVSPLYGVGVVYFMDQNGQIRGIMTWGLPFADNETGDLNPQLVTRMKHIVATNGSISALDSEENYHLMNTFLGKESQRLVALAVLGNNHDATGLAHGLDGPIERFSKPLYRYTEARPSKSSNLNVLKRKEGDSLGVLGENLYARDKLAMEDEESKVEEEVSNIPKPMYPLNVLPWNLVENPTNAPAESLVELNRFMAVQRAWEDNDNRARPGKEDPLWLRPGDEKRSVSQKQILIDYYQKIMFPHRN